MLLTEPNLTLGRRIFYYRKELGLTQVELAAIIGIYDKHLSLIETGKIVPRTLTLARLAAVFEVTIEELVGDRSATP